MNKIPYGKIYPAGFSLIELMVVLVVMAILAAIAYPSYQSQLEKGRVSEGKAALTGASTKMERCYSVNGTYKSCWPAAGINSETGFYKIMIEAGDVSDNTYTLTAERLKATGSNRCGNLTISSTGQEGISGANGGTVADCWH